MAWYKDVERHKLVGYGAESKENIGFTSPGAVILKNSSYNTQLNVKKDIIDKLKDNGIFLFAFEGFKTMNKNLTLNPNKLSLKKVNIKVNGKKYEFDAICDAKNNTCYIVFDNDTQANKIWKQIYRDGIVDIINQMPNKDFYMLYFIPNKLDRKAQKEIIEKLKEITPKEDQPYLENFREVYVKYLLKYLDGQLVKKAYLPIRIGMIDDTFYREGGISESIVNYTNSEMKEIVKKLGLPPSNDYVIISPPMEYTNNKELVKPYYIYKINKKKLNEFKPYLKKVSIQPPPDISISNLLIYDGKFNVYQIYKLGNSLFIIKNKKPIPKPYPE